MNIYISYVIKYIIKEKKIENHYQKDNKETLKYKKKKMQLF